MGEKKIKDNSEYDHAVTHLRKRFRYLLRIGEQIRSMNVLAKELEMSSVTLQAFLKGTHPPHPRIFFRIKTWVIEQEKLGGITVEDKFE